MWLEQKLLEQILLEQILLEQILSNKILRPAFMTDWKDEETGKRSALVFLKVAIKRRNNWHPDTILEKKTFSTCNFCYKLECLLLASFQA